jgi:hypothetical protein
MRTFNVAKLRFYALALATKQGRQGFWSSFQATSHAIGGALPVKIAKS